MPWSVRPERYGEFLIEIFEEWVGQDVGEVFVQQFETTLGAWTGRPGAVCVFAERCGDALIIEHDGGVYSCDHYVYPEYLLGIIADASLDELARSERQVAFGNAKADTLTRQCRACRFLFACNGGGREHEVDPGEDRVRLAPEGGEAVLRLER